MTSTLSVEVIKAQALELNEKFAAEQKEFLNLLSNVQVDWDDQLGLQDKLIEIQGQYQEANEAFVKILN